MSKLIVLDVAYEEATRTPSIDHISIFAFGSSPDTTILPEAGTGDTCNVASTSFYGFTARSSLSEIFDIDKLYGPPSDFKFPGLIFL